jgi:hypothetical protein
MRDDIGRPDVDEPDRRHRRLMRVSCERPSYRRTAREYEIAPSHCLPRGLGQGW